MPILRNKITRETRTYPDRYQLMGLGLTTPDDWEWMDDLDSLKIESMQKIRDYAEGVRQQIAGNPTALKASAWSSKEARARRIIDGVADAADVALVQAEADQRGMGETAAGLAAKQLTNAQQLLHEVAVIDGMESCAIAAVQAATDAAGVDAVMTAMQTEAEAAVAQLRQ